jgi:hypothetical protein
MKSLCPVLVGIVAINMLLWIQPVSTMADSVISQEQAARRLAVHNLSVQDRDVSGDLVNNSSQAVRDVELQIQFIWHWRNEFRPGKDAPGIVEYYTLNKDVAPGERVPFTYTVSSPLPSRPDGYFETKVSVAGFTEAGGVYQESLQKELIN